MKRNNISILIRTKNEERHIGYCIQSILDKIYKPKIVIVDDKSTDKTISIIKSFKEDTNINSTSRNYTNIEILSTNELNEYTPGSALNLGIKFFRAEFIMIVSAHVTVKKLNLDEIYKQFEENKELVAIFGNQNPVLYGKKITKRYLWSHFKENKKVENMYSELEDRYFLHNAFAIYKSGYLVHNLFDEYLMGKEDRYWANKQINENNRIILYDPFNMECDHHYTENGNTWKGIG